MRRWVSLIVTVAMIFPAVAAAAEGTMATWLSPQPGQIVSGGKVEVAIGYNTGSKLKVSSLELYIDGQFYVRKILKDPEVRGVCSFYWDTTSVEQGSHNLIVKVYAGDQVISKVYGTGTVGPNGSSGGLIDVRPPIVTFANVRAGDVIKGTKTIKMNAVDDSGKPPMVSLLVDDSLKLLKNTPPYTYSLDTTTYTDGDHSLKTYAYDEAGNRSDPAVIKVAFRNGDDKPVVTTMTVKPVSAPATPPATMSRAIPPSVAADTLPSIKTGAARAETPLAAAPSSVAPVVKPEPKPEPKAEVRSVSAPAPASKPAPALSSGPVKMASASGSTNLRKDDLRPSATASIRAGKPHVIPAASLSGLRNASAAKLPAARTTLMSAPVLAYGSRPAVPKHVTMSVAPKAVAPKHIVAAPRVEPKPSIALSKPMEPKHIAIAPKSSPPVRMAMASVPPAVHKISHATAPTPAVAAAPRMMAAPTASPLKNVPISHSAAVKAAKIAGAAPAAAHAVAPKIVAAPRISKATLKRVQVAMAPDIRSANEQLVPKPAISLPPAPPKQAKARLEKAVVPASGKVKARNFFQDMGGILFWDPTTHTVTACVGHMTIEMRIGHKMAKVNGHEFAMDLAPYVVNGRTFFEASSFSQACNLLESLQKMSKAEIR